jgi:hypothetical protein
MNAFWSEAASPKPGFHEKENVENYLPDQVCSGAISLRQARVEITTNWLNVYNTLPGSDKNAGSSDNGFAIKKREQGTPASQAHPEGFEPPTT